MKNDIPRWPESLPQFPTEMTELPGEVRVTSADLGYEEAIPDLLHDLYWFPEQSFYLYFESESMINESLHKKLEAQGIDMLRYESYFFLHPNQGYRNDFIRILPHEDAPEWRKKAAQGKMYSRVSLTLEPAVRKKMDFMESARVANQMREEKEDIVEAKPNFFGIGINLNALYRKLWKWVRKE